MLKRILAGVVLSLMLTGGAAAGPYEDGVAAYQRGDYATALRLFRPLGEQGNASAQYNLGVMYALGQGVPRDNVQAYMWFDLSARYLEGVERDRMVQIRDVIASDMTPAQIAEAQKLAREWKPKNGKPK
jgi:hypothetical protein